MVQTVDHDAVDDGSDTISVSKSSSAPTLFKPRSVYSHATLPSANTDSKNHEPVSRKSNSPLSPPAVVKNSFFMPTSSRDASVQVGQPPLPSDQMRRQIAKVTPFPVSPPATKPVARVSPQPQNISPPVQQPPMVSVVEEKAKNKDKIEAKSPEAERWTPLKSPPPISSIITPTVTTTTITSASNTVTNVIPAAKTSVTAAAATSPTLKTSPITKTFPSPSCSVKLPIPSNTPLAAEQPNTTSGVSTSDTVVTTDGEMVTTTIKKKKKKKHHSTAEHSGQEDGAGAEHKKKKKKKQKKEHKEHDPNDEPRKKKKKVKHSSKDSTKDFSKERVWVEKEATPVMASATKSPLKSPPTASPTVPTTSSHDPVDKIDEQVPEVSTKQEPTPLPVKREPSLPRESPATLQSIKEPEVEIENKLRPFLLSYYSSSGSDCSSPTVEDRELDDLQKAIPTPTAATPDDVFTKEQSTRGKYDNLYTFSQLLLVVILQVCIN